MSTNDQQRKFPTPADLDPSRAAARAAVAEELGEHLDKAVQAEGRRGGYASPVPQITRLSPPVELTDEQKARVEALHAARRVLGAPRASDGHMLAGWAWQAIELASYIVTGWTDSGPAEEDDAEHEDEKDDSPRPGSLVIGLNDTLPAGTPAAVAQFIDRIRSAVRPAGHTDAGDLEDHVKAQRDYVDRYLDKPDGGKELNAQGVYPVWGSEPPRADTLHDVTCNRWDFNQDTGRWTREVKPLDVDGAPSVMSAAWGPVLAEHGPFHASRRARAGGEG